MVNNFKKAKLYSDQRGWFSEIVKFSEAKTELKQVSVGSIKPGCIRGNHYHKNKKEWFFVIGGDAEFYIGDSRSKKIKKIKIAEKNQKIIFVPPMVSHAVKNTGKKIIYIIEVDGAEYNHKNPDAVPYIICKK